MNREIISSVVLAVLISGFLDLGASSPSVAQDALIAKSGEQITAEIVSRMRLEKLGTVPFESIVWCFKGAPAFAYVRGKGVFRASFDGSVEEILRADVPLGPASLRCNASGSVIAVFSFDGSELFLVKDHRMGRYGTAAVAQRGFSPKGQFLSPDGEIIVAPYKLTYRLGDDVLKEIRFVELDGDWFSWAADKVIFFRHRDFSIYSYDVKSNRSEKLAQVGARYRGQPYSVSGLQTCGPRILMSVASAGGDPANSSSGVFDVMTLADVVSVKGGTSSAKIAGANYMCAISKASTRGDLEETRYYFIVGGNALSYKIPSNLYLGYGVAVAPRDCLVRGLLSPASGGVNDPNSLEIVALRVLKNNRCESP